MIVPRALAAGDTVAIVAPSSPFEHALAWRGLGWLATRYRVRYTRGLFERAGYLAGDDARRRVELERALGDPDVAAVIAARGGYGASRFVHALDWDGFARHPKWIVGFSDVTALHVEAARVGVASMHAPHLTALGRGDAHVRQSFIDALERPGAPRRFDRLSTIAPGSGEGLLFGGNLTLLHACAAGGRLRVPRGAILFLEDVTERPFRIDRMLTTLALGGHFEGISGIALGDFTGCDPLADGTTVDAVLGERLGGLGVPVARGVPSGHARRNEPLVLGLVARLVAGDEGASLSWGDQR